ncbi:MAG TPA: Coagulation factor 5/8 type domain-containing protein [Thermomonospora sp.]|nr:Coagulation factor 5/8 type domain-containing protein [Thermomonospora sp.]
MLHRPRLSKTLAALGVLTALAAVPGTPVSADPGPPEPAAAAPAPVHGYLDAHSHLMSYEGFGGRIFCGKTFDPEGIEKALTDCSDHAPHGIPAWLENFTRHGSPFGTHDTVGYPTFKDWPAHDSLTHQQSYYTWLERSWRAGQRILVNQLVTNRVLCEVYPLKKYACDEMGAIRLQAQRTRELEAYIDKEHGGPGKGWFRVVRSPAEARSVIAQGKLAVVLGVETSEPFGCRGSAARPQCTKEQIDQGLDEMRSLGVSSMFLCHKFDNALCGVRFDSGALGGILNLGNVLSSGSFWQADTCTGDAHDHTISPSGDLAALLAGPLRALRPVGITLPVYPRPPHCNVNGLTELGEHMVRGMMRRGMIVELDHMSVKAADQTLRILEEAGYSGVVSGHSWSDGGYARRVYRLGGMITGYGHAADHFAAEWRRNKAHRDDRYLFGYGYGLDANGMGPLPGPRTGSSANPVRYPFTSPFDPSVTLDKARTGTRTWDVNTEGVAHYGLVPDWMQDLRNVVGDELITDLARGAEAYLQMWERTTSHP